MVTQEFIGIFVEVYNVGAAFIIILLIGYILLMMHRIDRDLLRARLFLNEAVMQRTWTFISLAGASFALNTLIKLAISFTASGSTLDAYYLEKVYENALNSSFCPMP